LTVRKVRKSRVRKGGDSPGKKSDSGESSGHPVYSWEKQNVIFCYDVLKMAPLQLNGKVDKEAKERILNRMKENNWAENRILRIIGNNRKTVKMVADHGIPRDLRNKLSSTLSGYGVPDWIIKGALKGATTTIRQWYYSTFEEGHVPKVKALRLYVKTEWYDPTTDYLVLPGGLKLRKLGENPKCKSHPIVPGWAMLIYNPDYDAFYLFLTKRVPPKERKLNVPLSYVKRQCLKRKWLLAVDVNAECIVVGTGDKRKEKRFPVPIKKLEPYRRLLGKLKAKYHRQGSYDPLKRRRGLRRRVRLTRRRMVQVIRHGMLEIAKEIIDYAWFLGSETEQIPYCIVIEDLRGLWERIREDKDIPKGAKAKITFMAYYRLHRWLITLAKLNWVPYIKVDPRGTSTTCPRCGAKLVEVGHRRLRCPAGHLEEDRDTIAIMNLVKRALNSGL